MDVRFIRLWLEVLNDTELQRMPPERFRQLINTWLVAGGSKPFGRLSENVEDLAWVLRMPVTKVMMLLDEFRNQGFLDVDPRTGLLVPHNWDARQFHTDHSGNLRVQSHRQRKRASNVTGNADETLHETLHVTPGVTQLKRSYNIDIYRGNSNIDLDQLLGLDDDTNPDISRGDARGENTDPAPGVNPPPDPPNPGPEKKRKPANRGTQIPDNFAETILTDENIAWAIQLCGGKSAGRDRSWVIAQTDHFIDWAIAKGAVYKAWDRAWKNWFRNIAGGRYGNGNGTYRGGNGPNGPSPAQAGIVGRPDDDVIERRTEILSGRIPPATGGNG